MRKDVGLILAAAVCFDLGVVIVPAQAAGQGGAGKVSVQDFDFQKIDSLSPNQEYLKIKLNDVLVSSKACQSSKGALVEFKGTKYCATGKHLPDAALQKK